MANNDAAFGFSVWGPLLRARMYAVPASNTINVFHGDPAKHGGAVLATAFGTMNIIAVGAELDGSAANLLGVVIAVMDENMDPVPYIAAAETGDSTVSGYVMIADHPDQEFLVQEDGAGTPIPLTSGGMNCDLESPGTLCLGTVGTGVSLIELDSSTAATTSTLDCKLHYPHLEDTVNSAYCRWVVTINAHHYGDTLAGL